MLSLAGASWTMEGWHVLSDEGALEAIAGATVPDASRSAANAAMDRYADGDDSAFGVLYDELGPRLFRFSLRQMRNEAAAEDIVQQTMLQMHCARDRFRRGADVLPWSFAIARRLMIDAMRRKRHQEVLANDPDEDREPTSTDAPDELLQGKQLAATLRQALLAVPEGQREAFILVREDGLSVAEAAEILGISAAAVKVRAHRAYEALREAVSKQNKRGMQ
jgi:RNA polymerase sigma-70 factor, ECF subfamily